MVEEINHDRRRFLATAIMTIHTSYNDYEIVAAIFWRMTSDVSASVLDVMYAKAPYIVIQRHAYSSAGHRINADHAWRVEAVGVKEGVEILPE
jgi:hypothetical protein